MEIARNLQLSRQTGYCSRIPRTPERLWLQFQAILTISTRSVLVHLSIPKNFIFKGPPSNNFG